MQEFFLSVITVIGIILFAHSIVYAITSGYYMAQKRHKSQNRSMSDFNLNLPPGMMTLFKEFVQDYHDKVEILRADRDGKNR